MISKIRNFCIIAHIDHGKSTLADRFLELAAHVPRRKMKEQFLDQMDLERERGITIKLQPVRLNYQSYELNLIDTPGHVDFSYEVSRSLAAVEGAVLLVDATQGIQAQTLANLYLALDHDLAIIPVINKIDLPNAQIEESVKELSDLLGVEESEVIKISAKKGTNVKKILEQIVKQIPAPPEQEKNELKALVFDSNYDDYKGAVVHTRLFSGQIKAGDKILFKAQNKITEVSEVGYFSPFFKKTEQLKNGQIGYLVTGFKNISDIRVGDTIIHQGSKIKPCAGYKEVKPMVFASLFPSSGDDYKNLRKAIEKLKLNDSSLIFEPESSRALGFGFRCGFLGLLHLEIVQARLEREYDIGIITTVPSVAYQVKLTNNRAKTIHNAEEWPEPEEIEEVREPFVKLDIITPQKYIGQIMPLAENFRGNYLNTEYLHSTQETRAILHYEMPLSSILTYFYDKLKSVSSGFASLNYEFIDYRPADITRIEILVAEEKVPALSCLVYKDSAYKQARQIVDKLKEIIPRQQFVVKIQALVEGDIIAASRLAALRKDVTAGLYGGDVSRKKKLLQKQKKGKKKMQSQGKVEIPTKAYLEVLKR
ncbi:MAG: translation elongation factor 4 [Patescibacteria group bacterium]|nr:translation elongation factor 4 [Patescibacteria group bacterium]